MQASITLLGVVCLVSVAGALAIVAQHLRKKPALSFATKITLLFGLGVFPASAAVSSTVTGMEATTHRTFCGSCHSMDAYVADADDPLSQSMAARHGRNPYFGDHNCYTCHADYGMLGYPLTKLNGMRHVYEYYLGGWRNKTPEQTLADIHLQKPYDNDNCRQCHTGTLADWALIPEHAALEEELKSNQVSCSSGGCHGYAHPFSKPDGASATGLPPSALTDEGVPTGLPEAARQKLLEARQRRADREAAIEREARAAAEKKRKAARDAAQERQAKPAGTAAPVSTGETP